MRTTEATVAATMIRRKDSLAAVTSTKKKRNSLAAATKTRRKVIPAAVMSIKKKRNTLAAAIITKKYKQTQKKPVLPFYRRTGLLFTIIFVFFNPSSGIEYIIILGGFYKLPP